MTLTDSAPFSQQLPCCSLLYSNLLCRGCLAADRLTPYPVYRLKPNYNRNEFVEDGSDEDDYEEEMGLCGACGQYSSAELIFCPHCGA